MKASHLIVLTYDGMRPLVLGYISGKDFDQDFELYAEQIKDIPELIGVTLFDNTNVIVPKEIRHAD